MQGAGQSWASTNWASQSWKNVDSRKTFKEISVEQTYDGCYNGIVQSIRMLSVPPKKVYKNTRIIGIATTTGCGRGLTGQSLTIATTKCLTNTSTLSISEGHGLNWSKSLTKTVGGSTTVGAGIKVGVPGADVSIDVKQSVNYSKSRGSSQGGSKSTTKGTAEGTSSRDCVTLGGTSRFEANSAGIAFSFQHSYEIPAHTIDLQIEAKCPHQNNQTRFFKSKAVYDANTFDQSDYTGTGKPHSSPDYLDTTMGCSDFRQCLQALSNSKTFSNFVSLHPNEKTMFEDAKEIDEAWSECLKPRDWWYNRSKGGTAAGT